MILERVIWLVVVVAIWSACEVIWHFTAGTEFDVNKIEHVFYGCLIAVLTFPSGDGA